MFNLLGNRVVGARVLDLFSGTGALGIEALSRGAAHVTFVDRSFFCIRAIEANLESLRVEPAAFTLLRSEALTALRHLGRGGEASFDLVLVDPPYGRELARKSLIACTQYAIVAESGLLVAEHEKRDTLPARREGKEGHLVLQRSERYGDTALTIYTKQ